MIRTEITVVVPTRNETSNIPALLASLPADLPLVVVDASDDETPDLIQRLRPTQTTVIRHPAHIAEARQIGAEHASTPWLLFTDADVIFAADYFQQLDVINNPAVDAIYGAKRANDEYSAYYGWFVRGQAFLDRMGIPAVSGSNLLVKRDVLLAVGGFDPLLRCNEDSEIGFRIARRGYRIRFDPRLVVYERDHRRLARGATRKTLHSLVRCTLLYLNLMPAQWRSRDWGYWKPQNRPVPVKSVESNLER